MIDESVIPSRGLQRRWVIRSAIVALVLAIYILSVGPAAFLARRTDAGAQLMQFVYAPLTWIRHTPLGEPLDIYIDFFVEAAIDMDRPQPKIESAPRQFASSPTQTMIAGKMIRFEASLNRDFMPICTRNGRPMSAFLRLCTLDKSPFPTGVRIEKAWVIRDHQAWLPDLSEPRDPPWM